MDGATLVREYYRSIDEKEYAALRELLIDEFTHRRPDMTIDGRDAFVAFMRDDRPDRATEHSLEAVYEERNGGRIAAEGTLLRSDGTAWFGFVDSFVVDEGRIRSVRTYTDADPD